MAEEDGLVDEERSDELDEDDDRSDADARSEAEADALPALAFSRRKTFGPDP